MILGHVDGILLSAGAGSHRTDKLPLAFEQMAKVLLQWTNFIVNT